MHTGTQGNPLNINLTHNHNVGKIDDVIGYPTKVWRAARKYSVNNTLPIAAINAWLQFSLAYIAAIIITHNDLSFIPAIFNPTLMSAYALVSVVLVTVFLTSLALKYMNKQEIKEKKKENTKEEKLIDVKIRGGKSGEISEIAKDALKIEIIPDLSDIGYKKQNFSIVLPISEEQNKILENQKEENRNKTILLITIPSAISAAIIVGALVQNRFSFTNIQGWVEISFISLVFIVAAVSICITLSKLRNNEINHEFNVIKTFDNLDILLPWKKGNIVSVMEKKAGDLEENDPLSRLIKLLDIHLTDFTNQIVNSFDKHLDAANNSLDKKLLEPANANIKGTLDNIGKNIKVLLDNLEEDIKQNVSEVKTDAKKEIAGCLRDISKSVDILCKEVGEDVKDKLNEINVKKLIDLVDVIKDKVKTLQLNSWIASFKPNTQPNQNEQARDNTQKNSNFSHESRPDQYDDTRSLGSESFSSTVEGLGGADVVVQADIPTIPIRNRSLDSESSSNDSLNAQLDEEKVLDAELAKLEKENRIKEKQEKVDKLKQKFSKQKEIKEWKEELNGKASEFLQHVLESTKLEIKDDQGKEVKIKNDEGEEVDPTLRNFENKIIIHWKNGSQTTCYMDKDGNLQMHPGTKVDFVDQNISISQKDGVTIACTG